MVLKMTEVRMANTANMAKQRDRLILSQKVILHCLAILYGFVSKVYNTAMIQLCSIVAIVANSGVLDDSHIRKIWGFAPQKGYNHVSNIFKIYRFCQNRKSI